MSTRQARPTTPRVPAEVRIEMVRLPRDLAQRAAMLRRMATTEADENPVLAELARAFAPVGSDVPHDEPEDAARDRAAEELERFREMDALLAGQAEVLEAISRGRAVVAGVVGLGVGVAATLLARRARRPAEVDSF